MAAPLAATRSATNSSAPSARWLLLIHQLPGKPDYLRVKVRRRLARLGAVPLKNSVYVLPDSDSAREDFQWLLREIEADGGEAALCASELVEGVTDAEIRALFDRERDAEYAAIIEAASTVLPATASTRPLHDTPRSSGAFGKRRRSISSARRSEPTPLLPSRRSPPRSRPARERADSPGERPMNQVWVTRRGIKVDRIGSAWLIRKAIDPEARFKFVDPAGYEPEPGELRFDMFDGEYTHEGPRCTFETLLARFDLADPALASLGEIVHDVDCKDALFGRAEAAGLAAFIQGLVATTADDASASSVARCMFDALYASLGQGVGT